MRKKNATPDNAQSEVLKKNGMNPLTWVVVQDLNHSMIIKHRITGEFRHIAK